MITLYPPERLWFGGKLARTPEGQWANGIPKPRGIWVDGEDWDGLLRWIGNPVRATAKEEHGAFCLAELNGPRCEANVARVTALGLDGDETGMPVARAHALLSGYRHVVYTTFSSTVEAPRWRAIVALSRPATGDEHARYIGNVHANLRDAGAPLDSSAVDPCRLWYLPCVRPGGHWECYASDGRPFDVDAALVTAAELEAEARAMLARAQATIGRTPTLDRVRAYLAAMDPAVSGSGGHKATFRAACVIVANVDSHAEQEALLAEFNIRCKPPWSEGELAHKLDGARKRSDLRPLQNRSAS